MTSFLEVIFKTFLHLLFKLGSFTGADEEGEEGEEEAVVAESENEANDESKESSTGAETLSRVSPTDDYNRDDCSRHPSERRDGQTETCQELGRVNIYQSNLPAVKPEKKRFLMINRKSEQMINNRDPRVKTPLAACLVTFSNSGLDIFMKYFDH